MSDVIAAVSDSTTHYHELHANDDYLAIAALQRAIWGAEGFDPVPNHVMHIVAANSGLVVGAKADDRWVGFALALPVRRGNGWLLWSHIAGVHPDYQGRGIGFQLKQYQRTWAIAHGYDVMGWTFDPMQRGNANFNLRRLGAISNTYQINIYGDMTDELNFGLKSDRLAVTWRLHDARVARLAAGEPAAPLVTAYPEDRFLLTVDERGALVQADRSEWDSEPYFAEIPARLTRLKRGNLERARQWQLALRHLFQTAFAAGCWVVDFESTDDRCWYILQKLP